MNIKSCGICRKEGILGTSEMKKEEKHAKNLYNLMAQDYHGIRTKEKGVGKFFNESVEMPAMLKMLGNVKNKKILDWGCGSGIYAKFLTKNGAIVKGFDISKEMIKIAKIDNPNLDLRVGSGNKIPFNEKFDIVFASLALHYLNDWSKLFKEIARILKDDGTFIFSVGNALYHASKGIKYKGKELRALGIKNYFKDKELKADWKLSNGKIANIITYNKDPGEIIRTAVKNGFEVIDYEDTKPIKKAKKKFPEEYEFYSKVPIFSVWKLRIR